MLGGIGGNSMEGVSRLSAALGSRPCHTQCTLHSTVVYGEHK